MGEALIVVGTLMLIAGGIIGGIVLLSLGIGWGWLALAIGFFVLFVVLAI